MVMFKRSASIYVGGYVFGVLSSAALIFVYPSLYYAFLELLRQKIMAQSRLIENVVFMIIVNNLLAASISSFGGTAVSKIVSLLDVEGAKRKALFYFLPVGILFVNGEVLGLFAVLYVENLSRYLLGVFPHGFFEIPAIILSGTIGLEISEESQMSEDLFHGGLNRIVKEKLWKFALVVLLIIVGGVIEGRGF